MEFSHEFLKFPNEFSGVSEYPQLVYQDEDDGLQPDFCTHETRIRVYCGASSIFSCNRSVKARDCTRSGSVCNWDCVARVCAFLKTPASPFGIWGSLAVSP